MQCSHCQAENSTGARFCSNCGALLPLRCSNCESLLAKGANFCNYCGQAVHTQSAADVARHSRLVAAAPEDLVDKVQAAPLSGERRIVTVLFADVVGSTNLSQQIDDKTWIEIINGAFDRILPAIYRFEGTIARTLGDAMIAFLERQSRTRMIPTGRSAQRWNRGKVS